MKKKYVICCVILICFSALFFSLLFNTVFTDSKKNIEVFFYSSQIVYNGNGITIDDLKKLVEKYGTKNVIVNIKDKKTTYEEFCKNLENIPTTDDAKESFEILIFLNNFIDSNAENRTKPIIYRKPYKNKTVLKIYGVTEQVKQNKIIEILKVEFEKRKWKTIELKFYEKEKVLITRHGDKTSYSRDNEKLLRTKIISKP